MGSLIKSQLIKQLSKFTKNLSPDKIQISTLKGEGELTNLELNEQVLMELMDLPTWLKLSKAFCNKVNIKIQWSKLKSQPIRLYLDEVSVSMETCSELRDPSNTSSLPSYSSGGRYGFGDRVVDGMYLHINSIYIDFRSEAFKANLHISRVIVQSVTPTWRTANDLQHTRISEKQQDLLLTFKQIDWQTLKIEADCMVETGDHVTTPLRLITNQSKIRISVKKRYSDCSIVATKIQFIMDDLLWILTDSQMKAAVVFARHMKNMIDKAGEQSKTLAANTLQKQSQSHQKSSNQSSHTASSSSPVSNLFKRFDIAESSYHVQTGIIDLHICDDINVRNRRRGVEGGAIGIAIMKLSLSHYPTRVLGQNRRSWRNYDENMEARDSWTNELITLYEKQLNLELKLDRIGADKRDAVSKASRQLVERLTILSIEDFYITTASSDDDQGSRSKKLLLSDKKALFLPPEMSAIHVEHTEYFFPFQTSLPTPCPNMYVKINPVKLTLDVYTLTWLNSFAMSLAKDVEELISALPVDTSKKKERVELRLEALMPKIVLPLRSPVPQYQHDRPDSIQILMSEIIITNNHFATNGSSPTKSAHADLLKSLNNLEIHTPKFPSAADDIGLISPHHTKYDEMDMYSYLSNTDLDPCKDSEVMCVDMKQFWMEFTGVKNSGLRPVSFVESFPISVWLTLPEQNASQTHKPDSKSVQPQPISVLVNIGAKICAQINHYQFCFLMRLVDSLSNMADVIANEAKLHEDEFTEKLLAPVSKSTDAPPELKTVILEIKEVQFALLAAPQINSISADSVGDDSDKQSNQSNSSVSNEICTDSMICNEPPTDLSVPESNGLTSNAVSIVIGADTDSGIHTTSSLPSSISTEQTDQLPIEQHQEEDFFNGRSRSMFYVNDTVLPPSNDTTRGNTLASAFSKMTSRVRGSINKNSDDNDSWDTLSTISGVSDDFEFVSELYTQEEEEAFNTRSSQRMNDEEERDSVISSSAMERSNQLFSVTVFKIGGIEVGLQACDKSSIAKVLVKSIDCEERGNIYYDDFQAQQLSEMSSTNLALNTTSTPIMVRFVQGPIASSLAYRADEKGFAHIKVSGYSMKFISSTLDKLGPLFKDETVSEPLPMLVEVYDFNLHLEDVSQPVYNTEAPNVPLQLNVDGISVFRGVDGALKIKGEPMIPHQAHTSPHFTNKVRCDKSTNTVGSTNQEKQPSSKNHKPKLVESASSAQLVQEMKYLQDENKALKDQILRLNERLIEKDHEEFHRTESNSAIDKQIDSKKLLEELEIYKKEVKLLRSQVLDQSEQIDHLQSTNHCLSETVTLLKNELTRLDE